MLPSLWISKTGLDAQQTQLNVIANNLANVSTNGFKQSTAVFQDLLYQTVRDPGAQSSQTTELPAGLQIGTGVTPISTERLHTQGNLQQTGNALDMAIQGQGFFQIQMPDGTLAYSRDGSFHTNSQGQLVNSSGFQLIPAVTIPANAQTVTISQDGVVSVTQPGAVNPATVGTIQLANFINPAGLSSAGQNLYQETIASGTPTTSPAGLNGMGTLNQGYVETSNVDVAAQLVQMIQTQRAYELNSKSITTSDQMLQALTQL